MSTHQDLIDAIHDRLYVTFSYHGKSRMILPACYGEDTKGNLALRGFQDHKGWRLFLLLEMAGFQKTERSFAVIPHGYVRGRKDMVGIFAQL